MARSCGCLCFDLSFARFGSAYRRRREFHGMGALTMPTFDTPNPISVHIDVPVGAIHLIASKRQDTTVVVNPSDGSRGEDVAAADRTEAELLEDRLSVKTPKSGGIASYVGLKREGSVDVTVELPQESAIDIKTGVADIRVDGPSKRVQVRNGAGNVHVDVSGLVDIKTGAGDVAVAGAGGRATVTSAGDIRIGRVDGDAEIKNLNGTTSITEVTGRLWVKSSNGDISVGRAHADVSAKTANGSIDVAEVAGGEITLETSAGGIGVGIGAGTAAWVDARTKFGRVHNSLEAGGEPSPKDRAAEIRARTSFGDITVYRSTTHE